MKEVAKRRLLTIAIPTFNRNKILHRTLELIIPQMESWVELIIVDNNSAIPVSETIRNLCEEYPNLNVRIVRNSANIGANANVLRCIEYCESEYIWILGDDDFPIENVLKKIFLKLESRDPVWVNFYSNDACQPIRA